MMFWRKKSENKQPDIVLPPSSTSRVEIEVAKDANKETKDTAKKVNAHVENLLVENGFTLKIVLAAHNPKQKRGGA